MSDTMPRNGIEAFTCQSWFSAGPQKVRGFINFEEPEEVPLRIGITGSHGCGKTTFAKDLSDKFDLPIIDEVARTVNDLGLAINQDSSFMAQTLMYLGQFFEENKADEFVADRTLVDVLAYSNARVQRTPKDEYRYWLTALENITYELFSHQYSVIFYVPIEFELKSDGVRDTDPVFQNKINELILYYLNSFEVDYFPITGSKRERINRASKYLKESGLLAGR